MHKLYPKVADQMLAIQAEMIALALWDSEAPSAEALASKQPFCVDTLSFPQWLQFIFVPTMAHIIERQGELPTACEIAPMAEMHFSAEQSMATAAKLIELLRNVDESLSAPR